MKIIKIKPGQEGRYLQFLIIGGQKDFIEFLIKLELPIGTDVNYKVIKENEIKMSIHTSSKEKFEQVCKKIDIVALEYI